MHRNRNTIALAGLLALLVAPAWTRANPILDPLSQRIAFQALLRDNNGDPLPGPTVNLVFNIYRTGNVLVEGPIALNNVPVNNGVVDVYIPVTPTSFNGAFRELGVSVNGGPEMSPRMPIGAVPYAFRVDRVESAELADSIELGTPTQAGALTLYRTPANTRSIVLDGGLSLLQAFGADGGERLSLSARPFGLLRLLDEVGANETVTLSAGANVGGSLRLRDSAGNDRLRADADSAGGLLTLRSSTAEVISLQAGLNGRITLLESFRVSTATSGGIDLATVYGSAAGGLMDTYDEAGSLLVRSGAIDTAGGRIDVYQSGGTIGLRLDGDSSNAGGGGIIYAYQGDGGIGAYMDGDSGGGGQIVVNNTAGSLRVSIDGDDVNSNGGGTMTMYAGDGSSTIFVDADEGGGGYMAIDNGAGSNRIILDGDDVNSNGGGLIEIRQADGNDSIVLDGDVGGSGNITVYQANGTNAGVLIDGDSSTDMGGTIRLYKAASTSTGVYLDGDSAGGGLIQVYNSAGTASITIDGDVSGDGRITTQELVITGGSDLSEGFDIRPAGTCGPTPGMVVCIDAARPGELAVSSRAYDRTVAGIISGAGGVKPGMMMGQKGTAADGQHPVALTGRVYCYVDASFGAIEPGDLLTTSPTAGHAMKVTDHDKARGAVIGKAMTPLPKGKGLVLVLVTLQ